jgi:two-component system response regulator BaeR
MKKVLIVEDDKAIRQTLRDFLRKAGLEVVEEGRGDEALAVFRLEKPDLVVLDLNLPGKDGIEVCREIRLTSQVPVIMLTARREEVDQIKGLHVGADDYIIKPFSPKVLVLKVKKMLERPPLDDPEIVRCADLELDTNQRTARQKGRLVKLTQAEFKILAALVGSPQKVFSRDELLDYLGEDFIAPDIFDRTIDSHIKNIRKKLGSRDYIRTIRGTGYQAWEDE